ncbi:hypothetical protein V6N13_071969 [Hibiscus sabdariffa]|uniref:Uncharacterized protein n=1 Tax=Hibiscus sabdariffa TaxID=183260 RepID=A0ABR2TC48_9ROSI
MSEKGKEIIKNVDESPQGEIRYYLAGSSQNKYSKQLADFIQDEGPIVITDREVEQMREETRAMEAPPPPPPRTSPGIHGPNVPRMRDEGKGIDDAVEYAQGGFNTQESMLMAMPPPPALHQTPEQTMHVPLAEEESYVGVRLREEIQEHPNSRKRPSPREVMAERLRAQIATFEKYSGLQVPLAEEELYVGLFPGNEPTNEETTRPQLLQLLPGAENGNQELAGAGVGATQTDGTNIRDPLPPSVGEATPRMGINIIDRQQPSGEGAISARRHQGDAASEQRD